MQILMSPASRIHTEEAMLYSTRVLLVLAIQLAGDASGGWPGLLQLAHCKPMSWVDGNGQKIGMPVLSLEQQEIVNAPPTAAPAAAVSAIGKTLSKTKSQASAASPEKVVIKLPTSSKVTTKSIAGDYALLSDKDILNDDEILDSLMSLNKEDLEEMMHRNPAMQTMLVAKVEKVLRLRNRMSKLEAKIRKLQEQQDDAIGSNKEKLDKLKDKLKFNANKMIRLGKKLKSKMDAAKSKDIEVSKDIGGASGGKMIIKEFGLSSTPNDKQLEAYIKRLEERQQQQQQQVANDLVTQVNKQVIKRKPKIKFKVSSS